MSDEERRSAHDKFRPIARRHNTKSTCLWGIFAPCSRPNSPSIEEVSWLYGDWQEPTDCVLLVTKSIGCAARVTTEKAAIYCWTWRTTTAVNGRLLCKDTTFELRAAWTAVGRHSRNSQLCLPSEEVVVQDGWSWTWRPHYERSALRKVRAVTLLFILSVTCPFWGGCYGLLSRTTWVLCSFESTTLATCCKKSEIKCLTSTDALKVWFSRT